MKPASAKAKGRRAAQVLKTRILERYQDLESDDIIVTPSGVTGPDLQLSPKAQSLFPFAIEVKNQERLNIWSCLKQASSHTKGRQIPLLVFTKNCEDLYISLTLKDFLSLI